MMAGTEPKTRKSLVSGRELFVCDNLIEPKMVHQVGNLVRVLHYVRKEKSRPGVPGGLRAILFLLDQLNRLFAGALDQHGARCADTIGLFEEDDLLSFQLCDPQIQLPHAQAYVVDQVAGSGSQRLVGLIHVPVHRHVIEPDPAGGRSVGALSVQGRPGRLVAARKLAILCGQWRGRRRSLSWRGGQMANIPKLSAKGIVLPHVNMVKPFGSISGEFNDGAIGPEHIAVAAHPARLKLLGKPRQAAPWSARARPADKDRCRC